MLIFCFFFSSFFISFNVRGDFLTRTTQYLNSSYAKYAKENDWDFENLELSIVKEDRKRLRHRNLNEQDTTEVVSYNVKGVHMKGTLTFGVSDSLPTVADIDVLLADFFTGTGREQYIISLKSSTDEILASTFNSYFTFPEKRTEYKDMVTLVDSEDPELEIVEDENEVTKLSKALIITICASVGGVLFMLVLTFCVMEYYRRKQIVKDEYSDDQQTTLPERFEDLHEHQADSDNRTSHTFKKHYPIGLPISSSEEYTSSTRSPSCDGESYREKTTVLSGRGRWAADDQTQQTEDTQSKADSLAEIEKKLSKLLADSHEESTVGQSTYASSVVSYATSPTSTTKDVKSLVSGPKKKSSQRSLSGSQRSTSSSKVSRESRSVTRINDSIREIEDNIAEINAEINETMGKSTRSRSISSLKLKKKEPRAPRCGNSVSKSLPSTMKRATSRNNNLNEIVDSAGEKENIASSANKAEHRRKPRKGKCDNSVSRTLHTDDKEKMDRMKQSRRHRSRRSQPEFGKTCHKNCLSTTNSQLRSSLKPTVSFGKSENNVRIHPNFAPDETKDGDGLSKKLTFNFSDVTESVAIDASDSFAVEMVPSTLGTTLGNDDVNEKDDSNTEVDKKNQSSNNETPGAKSRKSHRRQRTRTRLPPDSFSFSSSSTSSKTREKRLRVKERMQYSNPEISKTPGTIYGSLDGQ